MTALIARREFGTARSSSPPTAGVRPAAGPPAPVANWREYANSGAHYGTVGAPVTIVEFSDFQCPYCAKFARSVDSVSAVHPGALAVTFRHFPLTAVHAHAYAAAIAAECANAQGTFAQMHDVIFGRQPALGTVRWEALAREAGVRDSARFARCVTGEESSRRVQEDIALGNRLGVNATPTVIVNGARWQSPPTPAQLDSIVRAVTSGQNAGR
jgi:protein-disulfide isomerase